MTALFVGHLYFQKQKKEKENRDKRKAYEEGAFYDEVPDIQIYGDALSITIEKDI